MINMDEMIKQFLFLSILLGLATNRRRKYKDYRKFSLEHVGLL